MNSEVASKELTMEEKVQKYCLRICPLGTPRPDGKVCCSSYAGICLYGVLESLDPIA